MSEQDNENDDSTNVTDEGSDNVQGEGNTDTSADDDGGNDGDSKVDAKNIDEITDPDELREKLKQTAKQNSKLFARIQENKGLKFDKNTNKWVPKSNVQKKPVDSVVKKENNIDSKDLYTLIEAKVPKEDIEEVTDYAKLKGITIEDALKSNVVKTILSERAEERTTANATNTGPSRKGSTKTSGSELLSKALQTGEVPESDEDMEALVEARLVDKVKKNN